MRESFPPAGRILEVWKEGVRMERRGKKAPGRGLLWLLGCGGAAGALLFWSGPAGEGIRQGLSLCAGVMIPSLFPFLILSDFVARTRAGRLLERLFGPVARRVYRCPGELAPALLMSWIGGYPAGARVLAGMVRRGTLSQADADAALTFSVNSGPAFMAAVVGAGVFRSAGWGLFLYACQLGAGVLTGRLLCRGRTIRARREAPGGCVPAAEGFVAAVSSAAGGMLSICAFVLVFSAVRSLLEAWGLMGAWAGRLSGLTGGVLSPGGAACLGAGLLEIGGGCALAQSLPPGQGALVLPFLLSFSSLSVVCQVAACFGEGPADLRLLLRGRLLHGALTALFATPVLWGRFAAVPAMAVRGTLLPGSAPLLGTLALLSACAILACAVTEG